LKNQPKITKNMNTHFILYNEVMAHLSACTSDDGNISDHWQHTLDQRGREHDFADMMKMLADGNPVNARIRDMSYLVDASLIDLSDPEQVKILNAGEPEFGSPEKIIATNGTVYSSAFVNTVPLSARIIREIGAVDVERPVVFEVGGGMGLLSYQLLATLGQGIRFVAVDIPEILIVQEWYIRNCLPHLSTAFITDTRSPVPADADVVFVNAHIANSLDIGIDFAININSFQDMSADVANGYIRYIEAHISDNGIFHIQNTTGQSASSVEEPSGYDFDPYWATAEISLAEAIETCLPGTELRLVMHRTKNTEDAALRREIFDFCWHAMNVRSSWTETTVIDDMRGWPKRYPGETLADIITGTALEGDFTIYQNDPAAAFTSPQVEATSKLIIPAQPRTLADVFRRAQTAVIAEMKIAAATGIDTNLDAHQTAVRNICDDTATLAQRLGMYDSEYWSGQLASFLSSLGATDAADDVLEGVRMNASTTIWQLRFARLALRHTNIRLARAFTEGLTFEPRSECSAYIYYLDTLIRLGGADSEQAILDLRALIDHPGTRMGHVADIGRILARTVSPTAMADVERVMARLCSSDATDAERAAYDLISALGRDGNTKAARALWGMAEASQNKDVGLRLEISKATARWHTSEHGKAAHDLAAAAKNAWDRYYELGRIGAVYISLGDMHNGEKCLMRSIKLKPGNHMHYEFIGNTFFSDGQYKKAGYYFNLVSEMKPYMRHILARVVFCALPAHIQDAGVFGTNGTLDMIYQQSQSYYD
jgi:putative sugar O-methyltransferase